MSTENRGGHGSAACKGDIASAFSEAINCLGYGQQGGGTTRVDAYCGSFQIQDVCYTACHIILFVVGHYLKSADVFHQFAVWQYVVKVVAIVSRAGEDA